MTFVHLYDEHYDEVHAFCGRRVGYHDADDAAAEVFVAAWRRIDSVDTASARAWLFGVARHVVLNQWRSRSRRNRLVDRMKGLAPAGRFAEPETVVVRRAEDEQIWRVLAKLRENDREILRLAAWEELTGPEIAIVMGISTTAAQQRLHRAKKRLAKLLATEREAAPHSASRGAGA